jgi:hypothetical protein
MLSRVIFRLSFPAERAGPPWPAARELPAQTTCIEILMVLPETNLHRATGGVKRSRTLYNDGVLKLGLFSSEADPAQFQALSAVWKPDRQTLPNEQRRNTFYCEWSTDRDAGFRR